MAQKGKFGEWITEDGLKRIESWARDGLTEKDIAEKKIGVSERSFSNWKQKYPSIVSALKRGKRPVDMEVENQLLRNAMGYEYEETETTIVMVGDKERKTVKRHKKYSKPDTTAQIFWLKNRKPDLWRDRHNHDHSGEVTSNINHMSGLDEETLRKLAELGDGDED